ncbi:MAG: zinc-dependent metalloprotease [Bacteroidetes bacterium]|nr:zinc-dependent metalloprotease [Bacteroidota bacterium]
MKQLHTGLAILIFITAFCPSLSAQYTIPVVVHVVHNNGPENISDSLIHDALAEVNRNYNAQNASLSGVASPFVSIIGNMQIEFCLAHTDPQGQLTTGIERIVSPLTYVGDSDAAKINQWPSDRYMNMWVVDSLRQQSLVNSLPGTGTHPMQAVADTSKDGVVAAYFTFLPGQRGLLTNFIAHYFNLDNIWGNSDEPETACGDDSISDTPVTAGSLFFRCDTSRAFCDTAVVENMQNFMNWSHCACMFTAEQVARVHHTLQDPYAHRSNLWQQSNLAISCAAPTDVKTVAHDKITVGPNPFDHELFVYGQSAAELKIQISDLRGRLVLEEVYTNSAHLILPDLPAGIYTISIQDGDSRHIFKLVRGR